MIFYNFIDIDSTTVLATYEMDSTTFNPIEITSNAINEQTTTEGKDFEFWFPKDKEYGSTNNWFTTSTADYTSDFDSYATTTESGRSGVFDDFSTIETNDITTENDRTTLEDFATNFGEFSTTSSIFSTDETQKPTTSQTDTTPTTNYNEYSTFIESIIDDLINENDNSATDRDTTETNWDFTTAGSDGFFTTSSDTSTHFDDSITTTQNSIDAETAGEYYTTLKTMVSTVISNLIEKDSSETTTTNVIEISTPEIEINNINDNYQITESNQEPTILTILPTSTTKDYVNSSNEEKESSTLNSIISTLLDNLINENDTSATNDNRITTSDFDSSEETTENSFKSDFTPSNTEIKNDTMTPFLESITTTIKSLIFDDLVKNTTDPDDIYANINNPNLDHEFYNLTTLSNQAVTEIDENILDIETIKPTIKPEWTLNGAALEEIVDEISENETTPSTLEILTTTVKSIIDKATSYIVDTKNILADVKDKEVATTKIDVKSVIKNTGNLKKK